MDRNTCLKIIRRKIDKSVQKFIFNNRQDKDDFLTTADEINGYFSNIFNLTFALIYSKFRAWKQNGGEIKANDSEKFNSYMRVNKTFSEMYIKKNLTFSTIEPTIIDAQLDVHYQGVLCRELGLNKLINPDNENHFAYFVQLASRARTSSRALQVDEKLENKCDELIELLNLFPFIFNLTIINENLDQNIYGDIYFVDDGTKIPFNGACKIKFELDFSEQLDTFFTLLCVNNEVYFLEEIVFDSTDSSGNKDVAYCNYAHIGGESSYLRLNATTNSEYIARDGELMMVSPRALNLIVRELRINARNDDIKKIIIKDFYAINYRYVKQLTLSVSDILTAENKKCFTAKYGPKYPELFNHVWDTIIAILIVKESATSILQFLFSIDEKAYSQLLYNLQTRFGAQMFNAELVEQETSEEVKSAFNRWVVRYFGEHTNSNEISNMVIENQRNSITAEVRAVQIIEYLSELLKINEIRDKKYKNKYPLNINSHISMLEWLIKADLPIERKKERAQMIVLRTLKSLYVFYCGFFKYAEIKNDFIERSKLYVYTGKAIDEFQDKANAAFRDEVKLQLVRLKSSEYSSVPSVLKLIDELNNECMFVKGKHSKNEILREYLGRYQLLDYSEINPLEELLDFTNVYEKQDIDYRIKRILEIYDYLQNGKERSSGIDGIYPYVGTYEYTHETRDGYKIAHFYISSPLYEKEQDIEILSEFRYSINSKYYCLPNKMCCNNEIKLWIEPTIISYKNFAMVDEEDD